MAGHGGRRGKRRGFGVEKRLFGFGRGKTGLPRGPTGSVLSGLDQRNPPMMLTPELPRYLEQTAGFGSIYHGVPRWAPFATWARAKAESTGSPGSSSRASEADSSWGQQETQRMLKVPFFLGGVVLFVSFQGISRMRIVPTKLVCWPALGSSK